MPFTLSRASPPRPWPPPTWRARPTAKCPRSASTRPCWYNTPPRPAPPRPIQARLVRGFLPCSDLMSAVSIRCLIFRAFCPTLPSLPGAPAGAPVLRHPRVRRGRGRGRRGGGLLAGGAGALCPMPCDGSKRPGRCITHCPSRLPLPTHYIHPAQAVRILKRDVHAWRGPPPPFPPPSPPAPTTATAAAAPFLFYNKTYTASNPLLR
jgi:hypothetical protein